MLIVKITFFIIILIVSVAEASQALYEDYANASGIAYEENAAEDSWMKTISFLRTHLE
tara:strand:- start:262 stop:435 length:174 start_codon:yes stop_codon:yes gene_type:complete